jgi:5'-3' exonuclease
VYKNIYKEEHINEKLLFNKFMIDFMYSCRLFIDKGVVDKIICCYDSEENFRKTLYPNYKSNRTKKEESFYNVLNYSKKYFAEQGFIVTQIKDLEADDAIGLWIERLKGETNIILSADEDIRQLLDEKVIIYNNNSKDKRFYYYTKNDEVNLYAFEKSQHLFENPHWILFKKMILGCDGDMVPKLLRGRIGEATLKKKIFDKITFDRKAVSDNDLVSISLKLNDTFKDEEVLIKELDTNLSLVNLCDDHYHSDSVKQETLKHFEESKFTYKGNYQFV